MQVARAFVEPRSKIYPQSNVGQVIVASAVGALIVDCAYRLLNRKLENPEFYLFTYFAGATVFLINVYNAEIKNNETGFFDKKKASFNFTALAKIVIVSALVFVYSQRFINFILKFSPLDQAAQKDCQFFLALASGVLSGGRLVTESEQNAAIQRYEGRLEENEFYNNLIDANVVSAPRRLVEESEREIVIQHPRVSAARSSGF